MVKFSRLVVLWVSLSGLANCATSGDDGVSPPTPAPNPTPSPSPSPTPTPTPTPDAPEIPDGGGSDPDAGPAVTCTANSQCVIEGQCCFGPAFGIEGQCTVGVIDDESGLGCNPFGV